MTTVALSPRLRRAAGGQLVHWCPGCNYPHVVGVDRPLENGARWTWDGNADAPTLSPSVHVGPGGRLECHYFLEAGRLRFLPDCHHALAGQVVDLPKWPDCG